MADKDREDAETPSLEMPSLGGMLRRRKAKGEAAPEPVTEPEPVAPPLFADEVATDDETAAPTPATAETPAAETPTTETPAAETPLDDTAAETSARSTAVATATRTPDSTSDDPEDGEEPAARGRRELALPAIPSHVAAALTGVVVGLLAVGLTWLGLQGCELVRGTTSCGGAGLLMLLLILAAMVTLGALMLRAWGIPDATSTSVLAVGLIAVLCLLLLIDVLMSPWMLLVIPLIGAATYVLAHAVTAKYAEPTEG